MDIVDAFSTCIEMAVMKSVDFKRWRKNLGFSQKDAAHALGIKRRVIQYYEKGERDGKKVDIPLYIRLACYALQEGVTDFEGTSVETSPEPVPLHSERPAIDNADAYDSEANQALSNPTVS